MRSLELQLCVCLAPLPPGRRKCDACRSPRVFLLNGFDSASDVADSEGHGFGWEPGVLNGLSAEVVDDLPELIAFEPNAGASVHCDRWDENDERHLMVTGHLPPEKEVNWRGHRIDRRYEAKLLELARGGLLLKRGRR